jgi:DNA gyrase/topoisomerase IV subunit B
LPVDDGGTHVNGFFDLIKEFFITKSKKSNLKFQPNDCLSGLRIYFSLELEKPDYSSQSKDKLINRKDHFNKLFVKLKNELEKYFTNNSKNLAEIITFFDEYRKKLDSKKIKGGAINGKRASTKFTKLRDCTGNHGELYVVEGDSAGGGFIDCRSSRIHAILPLRGKIPSIVNNKDDILKNKEISELIGSLGTGIGPNFDISKLKYNKIICATDPDPDGGHIFCLMTIALAILVPEVIKKGHFYLSRIPLYAEIGKGKLFNPIWSYEELNNIKNQNKETILIKGLGQLSPWQLKICCLDEKTRKLERVNYSEDIDKIIQLFSDVNIKRKLLKD